MPDLLDELRHEKLQALAERAEEGVSLADYQTAHLACITATYVTMREVNRIDKEMDSYLSLEHSHPQLRPHQSEGVSCYALDQAVRLAVDDKPLVRRIH